MDCTSNDCRALNDGLKNSEAEVQIVAQTKIMVSPIIRGGERFFLRWDGTVQKALFAGS